MHSKRKGAAAELHVACELTKLGYAVFKELGDLSRTDLVIEVGGSLLKVQVKYISRKDGCYRFSTEKSGPGYRFRYRIEDVDVFALYCVEDDEVAWILAKDIIPKDEEKKGTAVIRSPQFPSKNNQTKGVRQLSEFSGFDRLVLARIAEIRNN